MLVSDPSAALFFCQQSEVREYAEPQKGERDRERERESEEEKKVVKIGRCFVGFKCSASALA